MINGFYIGNILVPYYGFMICIGLFAAGILGFILTKRFFIAFEDFIILYAYVGGFAIMGAKALYLIIMAKQINWSRITDPDYLHLLMSGGFVFYGGLIGGIIALPVVKKIHKIDVLSIIKVIVPCIPLAHAMGRIGCHLTGCCYGAHYDGLFHIVYHNNLFAPNDIGLFPVQLLEAVCNLILAAVLLKYLLKKGPVMNTIYIYVISYSVIRFILEYFRGDASRGFFMNLSTSQIISIFLLISTLLYMMHAKKKTEPYRNAKVNENC